MVNQPRVCTPAGPERSQQARLPSLGRQSRTSRERPCESTYLRSCNRTALRSGPSWPWDSAEAILLPASLQPKERIGRLWEARGRFSAHGAKQKGGPADAEEGVARPWPRTQRIAASIWVVRASVFCTSFR